MEPVPPGPDVAERLGQWLNAFDAVRLHGTHESLGARAAGPSPARRAPPADVLQAAFARLRRELEAAIASAWSGPQAAPDDADGDFAPHRQRLLELQRLMESRIGPWRAQLRQALAAGSPALRQLVALDAAWEQVLAPREARLLASVPQRLERRWRQARGPHFSQEAAEIVRAELEVRLQPVMGLMEAYSSECRKWQ